MKTKYKFLLGILTVIACILFGCEKRESVSFEELTAVEAEPTSGGSERVKEDVTVEPKPADEEPETLTEENAAQTLKEEILVVHICGAVNAPGVYELPVGSRIYQAVLAAGGFCEEADRDFLNQAQMIGDGSRIYVPTKEEASLADKDSQAFITGSAEGPVEGESITNSGLVNTGRLGAQGLYNVCSPVSSADVKPGDLVFFVGTYDTPGVSHVGIYVGDNVMLHCGDPIQYTSINTSYWQSHFYAFGRPNY